MNDFAKDAKIFKAFCDIKRFTILDYLKSGEKCPCILIENMNIGQSALSYHMKILCDSGIVKARGEGKWPHYSLSDHRREYAFKRLLELTTPSTNDINKGHRKMIFIKINISKKLICCTKKGLFLEMVKSIWLFFQDQILGMKWLNNLIGNGLSQLGLNMDSRLGGSIQFFIYDAIKIVVLLCFLIFFILYIQSYFLPE